MNGILLGTAVLAPKGLLVTTFGKAFRNCSSPTAVLSAGSWDMSSVATMKRASDISLQKALLAKGWIETDGGVL